MRSKRAGSIASGSISTPASPAPAADGGPPWKAQHCVELFLPLPQGGGEGQAVFEALKARLAAEYGGVTAYVQAPAEGLWADGGGVEQDRIVVLEVMVDALQAEAWGVLKRELEERLGQKEILIRATPVVRLAT